MSLASDTGKWSARLLRKATDGQGKPGDIEPPRDGPPSASDPSATIPVMTPIPADLLADTASRLVQYHREWQQDIPMRLHSRSLDRGGNLDLHPEFLQWLAPGGSRPPNPDGRMKLTKAMRMLRTECPREFDVTYRIMVVGSSIPETADWLNERAIRGGHPERYTDKDATVILIAGIDKISYWY